MDVRNFQIKHAVKVKATTIYLQTELVQTKFNMGTLCVDNYHQSFRQLIDR